MRSCVFWCSFGSLLLCCGCREEKRVQAPAPLVKAFKAIRKDIPCTFEAPAKITGSLEIQVRAQVSGILKARLFQEGQYVHEGDKLFIIDKAPYEAALTQANGNLAQAESEQRRTYRDYGRMSKLFKDGAISQKEHDDSLSAYEKAEANLKVARGALHQAEINLGYTDVKAPISGIVRKEAQSVGNLVTAGANSSLLTSMVKICPLHADFSFSGSVWSKFYQKRNEGKLEVADLSDVRVEVTTSDGVVYPHEGRIIFVDSSEDELTSSISAKAEIPADKEQKILRPGQFVRIKVKGSTYSNALVIPASALISTSLGFSVYVINEDKTVKVRPVKAEIIENYAVVSEGLSEGEVVVSEGLVKVRPGSAVNPLFSDTKNTTEG